MSPGKTVVVASPPPTSIPISADIPVVYSAARHLDFNNKITSKITVSKPAPLKSVSSQTTEPKTPSSSCPAIPFGTSWADKVKGVNKAFSDSNTHKGNIENSILLAQRSSSETEINCNGVDVCNGVLDNDPESDGEGWETVHHGRRHHNDAKRDVGYNNSRQCRYKQKCSMKGKSTNNDNKNVEVDRRPFEDITSKHSGVSNRNNSRDEPVTNDLEPESERTETYVLKPFLEDIKSTLKQVSKSTENVSNKDFLSVKFISILDFSDQDKQVPESNSISSSAELLPTFEITEILSQDASGTALCNAHNLMENGTTDGTEMRSSLLSDEQALYLEPRNDIISGCHAPNSSPIELQEEDKDNMTEDENEFADESLLISVDSGSDDSTDERIMSSEREKIISDTLQEEETLNREIEEEQEQAIATAIKHEEDLTKEIEDEEAFVTALHEATDEDVEQESEEGEDAPEENGENDVEDDRQQSKV